MPWKRCPVLAADQKLRGLQRASSLHRVTAGAIAAVISLMAAQSCWLLRPCWGLAECAAREETPGREAIVVVQRSETHGSPPKPLHSPRSQLNDALHCSDTTWAGVPRPSPLAAAWRPAGRDQGSLESLLAAAGRHKWRRRP